MHAYKPGNEMREIDVFKIDINRRYSRYLGHIRCKALQSGSRNLCGEKSERWIGESAIIRSDKLNRPEHVRTVYQIDSRPTNVSDRR